MSSFYYPVYQLVGWLLLYAGIVFSVSLQPTFTNSEFIFAAILLSSGALASHLIRLGYKRFIKAYGFVWQTVYLLSGAIAGGFLAGLVLMLGIYFLANTQWFDPIPSGQWPVIFDIVYWANSANMVIALLLWSALYLAIVRSRQLRDAQHALSRGQLELLLQQLNPHFLFNMLNNIRALIIENPTKARDALAQLADMLRYSLRAQQSTTVNLRDELEVVEEYIALNQIQYESRLRFHSNIQPAAYQAMIPRLLLQQSIENAIKHGIAKLSRGGTIRLSAQVGEQRLEIVITNPIQAQSTKANSDDSTGLGLANSRSRLKLLYGHAGELRFNLDEVAELAHLEISIPYQPGDTSDEGQEVCA